MNTSIHRLFRPTIVFESFFVPPYIWKSRYFSPYIILGTLVFLPNFFWVKILTDTFFRRDIEPKNFQTRKNQFKVHSYIMFLYLYFQFQQI